jgi:hypothetical protein
MKKARVLPTAEERRLARGEVITRMATLEGGPQHGQTILDEVVAENCVIHLESMSASEYCLIVYGRAETVWYVIGAKRAPVTACESWREKTPRKKVRPAVPRRRPPRRRPADR